MATPDVLDFDGLLKPISDENPSGAELKENDRLRGVYQAAKDARETARATEKRLYQSAWLDEPGSAPVERPDWDKVHSLTTEIIAQHSKDLWIAAWLIESLARLKGFAGVRDGFRLTRELAERFWPDIHPRPDEDGYSTTVAQLTGLNGDESEGALIAPIYRIAIVMPRDGRGLSLADHTTAVELDKIVDPEKRAQRIAQGAVTLEAFDQAVRETSAEFFQALLEDVQLAIDEFFRLSETLEAKCGTNPDGYPAAPPTSAIRNALVEVRDRVQVLAANILGTNEAGGSAAGTTDEASPTGEGGVTTSKKGMNRDEAFRQLLQVAEFFRRTEPHSPVSYALEQAVRWGRMPLPELLSELISDSGMRADLFRRMGIPNKENSESSS
jgi:type VI secretion system protein ImpA